MKLAKSITKSPRTSAGAIFIIIGFVGLLIFAIGQHVVSVANLIRLYPFNWRLDCELIWAFGCLWTAIHARDHHVTSEQAGCKECDDAGN